MPGTILDIDLPTDNDSFVTCVEKLAEAIATLQADIEPKIDSGALDLRSALGLNGFPLTDVGGVRLVGGETTVVGTLYVDGSGDLHMVSASGDVRITSNGAIDVASLGTIGGDYGGGNPASVTYNDISGEYRFLEDVNVWATLKAGDLVLVGDNGTVRFGVDDAVNGDITFNIKSLPASGVGGLAFDAANNAVVDATVTRESAKHLFTDIDVSGDITMSGGSVRYGTNRPIVLTPGQMGGNAPLSFTSAGTVTHYTGGTGFINAYFRLPQGARISSWSWTLDKSSTSGTVTARLWRLSTSGATAIDDGTGTVSNNANAPGVIALGRTGVNYDVVTDDVFFVQLSTSGQSGDTTFKCVINASGVLD